MGKNRKEDVRIHQKFTSVEQKLEGINNAIEWGVNKGVSSVLQNLDARTQGATKVDATLPREHIKSESSASSPMFRFG